MRIFAISDIHIDYEENFDWVTGLSKSDYLNDVLILAGDVSGHTENMIKAFFELRKRFLKVVFVPGNHDIWVGNSGRMNSLEKFDKVLNLAKDFDIMTSPLTCSDVTIVPLFGWYDYTFGSISEQLYFSWADYKFCVWPEGYDDKKATEYFIHMNQKSINSITTGKVISFSHFLPRIDVMPPYIPMGKRVVYPVLGSNLLDEQIRKMDSIIHIYGHSHVNMQRKADKTLYINNAYGYPHEIRITAKKLLCIYEK